MEEKTFEEQIDRLRANYSDSLYKAERVREFWRALERVPDHLFIDAVGQLIANSRQAPMLKDLLDAIDAARVRDAELKADWARMDAYKRGREGIVGALSDLAERSASVKSYAEDCVSLIRRRISGQVKREEFEEEMKLLDEAARMMKERCAVCGGEGYVIRDGVYRCKCLAGQRIPEKLYGQARPDGSREITHFPTIN